eukprot:g54651.t1
MSLVESVEPWVKNIRQGKNPQAEMPVTGVGRLTRLAVSTRGSPLSLTWLTRPPTRPLGVRRSLSRLGWHAWLSSIVNSVRSILLSLVKTYLVASALWMNFQAWRIVSWQILFSPHRDPSELQRRCPPVRHTSQLPSLLCTPDQRDLSLTTTSTNNRHFIPRARRLDRWYRLLSSRRDPSELQRRCPLVRQTLQFPSLLHTPDPTDPFTTAAPTALCNPPSYHRHFSPTDVPAHETPPSSLASARVINGPSLYHHTLFIVDSISCDFLPRDATNPLPRTQDCARLMS